MGKGNASIGLEKIILYSLAIVVWAINATTLSISGGGFFGDVIPDMEMSPTKVILIVIQIILQVWFAWWNFSTLFGRTTKNNNNIDSELRPMNKSREIS